MATNKLLTWWNEHQVNIKNGFSNNYHRIDRWFTRLSANITRWVIIGIIINIIVATIFPDFLSKYPAIYGWFNFWADFGNICIEITLKAFYAIFSKEYTIMQFWSEYTPIIQEFFKNFAMWVTSL